MSGADRYQEAYQALAEAAKIPTNHDETNPAADRALAEAQVQATLALAAATVLPLVVHYMGDTHAITEWARVIAPDVTALGRILRRHTATDPWGDDDGPPPEPERTLPVEFADGHGSMWTYRGIHGEPLFNLRLAAPGDGGRNITLDLDEAERLFTAGLNTVRAIRTPIPGSPA